MQDFSAFLQLRWISHVCLEPAQISGAQQQTAHRWWLQIEVSGVLLKGVVDGEIVDVLRRYSRHLRVYQQRLLLTQNQFGAGQG